MYHSSRTCFSLSPKSCHSALQSSGFKDEVARALEESFPANTIDGERGPVSFGLTRTTDIGSKHREVGIPLYWP